MFETEGYYFDNIIVTKITNSKLIIPTKSSEKGTRMKINVNNKL